MRGTGHKFTGAKERQKNCGLGDVVINAKRAEKRCCPTGNKHSTSDFLVDQKQMTSVVDESDFLNVVAKAHLAREEFVIKREIRIVDPSEEFHARPNEAQLQFINEHARLLRIPRRPHWDAKMTKQQVEERELTAFYQWRQQLSFLEENRTVAVTPFEKNLDFWRQLWRVVEFSDLIFQIVDCRNPLLFFSRDLFQYAREVQLQQKHEKKMILVLNKADLVPLNIRQQWSQYFTQLKIQHIFFSALREEAILKHLFNLKRQNVAIEGIEDQIKKGEADIKQVAADNDDEESSKSEQDQPKVEEEQKSDQQQKEIQKVDMTMFDKEQHHKDFKKERRQQRKQQRQLALNANKEILSQDIPIPEVLLKIDDEGVPFTYDGFIGSAKIISRQQLLDLIRSLAGEKSITVGTIGFPNIGKSSIINCLSIETGLRTAISETPGKTKHFQTIQLDKQIKLCDCPGLVFPSFSHVRADFVLNGILPVDKERDYVSYLKLLCKRIPARVFSKMYQLDIKKQNKFETGVGMRFGQQEQQGEYYCDYMSLLLEFEQKLGVERGVVGRRLVKDLFRGKLLWIALPPRHSKRIVKMSNDEFVEKKKQEVELMTQQAVDVEKLEAEKLDDEEGLMFGEEDEEEVEFE